MKYFKNILTLYILVLFLITSKYTQAQKFYYFENIKTGKSYGMGQNQLYFKLEVGSNDSNVARIYKEINCSIDSFSETKLFISKFNERIEIFFKNGEVQTSVNSYTKKGYIASYSFKDSINVGDIIYVNDRSEFFNRYKFIKGFTQVVGVSLGLVTVVGPFVFNEYFKVVGISFVSSIPIFITSAILENKYILKGKKPNETIKWKLVYR
jgi:hypothetical protein